MNPGARPNSLRRRILRKANRPFSGANRPVSQDYTLFDFFYYFCQLLIGVSDANASPCLDFAQNPAVRKSAASVDIR
jgi:hypothetical protein